MFILKQLTGQQIQYFLTRCKKIGISESDLSTIYSIAKTSIKYYMGSKTIRQQMHEWQDLENKWYESLINNNPWYGVYGENYYIADLWACWVVYSRKYLLSLFSDNSLFNHSVISELQGINSIIDLGCGIGLTTSAFKEIFPNSVVYGTNILDTPQADFALEMSKEYNWNLCYDIDQVGNQVDLIFASEYFEHFYSPMDHLRNILSTLRPKYLLIANSFGTYSIGHFDNYLVDGNLLNGKETSKLFNKEMKKLGYINVKTKLWNNRPSYWVYGVR